MKAANALVCALFLACSGGGSREYLALVDVHARAALDGDQPPRADPSSGLLFLPVGSGLTYSFAARRSSELRIERVAIRGEATALEIVLSSDETPNLLAQTVSAPAGDWALELPVDEPTALSLTLSVEGRTASAGDGVLLTRPTMWGVPDGSAPERSEHLVLPLENGQRPNVVIYLIDTLRRDRLGAYGYARPVSPNIDEFAAGATLFEHGVAQSSWTKASVASMWTGVWPPAHGTYGWSHRLPEHFELLPEELQAAGYETAAFLTNVNSSSAFGVAQGFDHVWYEKKERSDRVTGNVVEWLDDSASARPLFVFIHTMDPHAGYNPGEPFRSRFAPDADQMPPWRPRWRWPIENLPFFSDLYDGEVAQNDAAFGELMTALLERGLFDSSLIVLLSDHGEEFKEHGGWRHGRVLHAETLNVPIVVKLPGQSEGRRSGVAASHVDILPTVREVAGLAPSPGAEGQSLVRPLKRPVFSHLRLGTAPLQYSVVDTPWKLIRVHGKKPATRLYNLEEDPGETVDLAASLPIRVALLEGLLRERLAATAAGAKEEVELTEDLRRSLRALGYLQ